MQMAPKNNGAMGRRRLKLVYEPGSGGRLTAMLMRVLRPEWDEAALRGLDAWEAAWKVWEKNVSMYEVQDAESISPGTKIAIVTRRAPPDVKAVIRQAIGAIAGDYDRLAQLVRDFVASGKVYESSGLRGDGPVPMDVGGIYDKGGKAKGKSKGTVKSNDKCVFFWGFGLVRQGRQVPGKEQGQGQNDQGALRQVLQARSPRQGLQVWHQVREVWRDGPQDCRLLVQGWRDEVDHRGH